MSEDAKDLRRQELALGAVAFGPRSSFRSLQDDQRAHELEAEARKVAAEIRLRENEERRAEGAREEREAVVRWLRYLRPAIVEAHGEVVASLIDALARDVEAGEHRKP